MTFTWSEAPSSFDTPLDLTARASFQAIVPVVVFNGTDEEADTPDANYWTRDDGGSTEKFSVGAWVNVVTAADSDIMAKHTTATDDREWQFILNSEGKLTLELFDESMAGPPVNSPIKTVANAALSTGSWIFVAGTYNGDTTPVASTSTRTAWS